ncbi:MAG: nitrogen regulation protein NR(II) [Vicinamibacterales bacterium]
MSPEIVALLGLTAIVGAVAATLMFAALRFLTAAGDGRRRRREGGETALLSAALEQAVTTLKAQERATAARAEASERLAGEIISSLTAGLIVVGLGGEVRILNPAARRMLGVADNAPLDDYRIVINEPAISDIIGGCIATALPVFRRTVRIPERRHDLSHVGVTVSPYFDPQGARQGVICLFSDLSSVKKLEEQLRLKESLAAVGELTAGIAHEFRNGLATIHGYGRLFDLDALPSTYREYVEAIRAETESLNQIVTNFLNFARPAELTLTTVHLKATCERVADELRADARALGGDVTLKGEFGVIDGDEVLLRQAFSNLLRNAVQACAGASIAPVVVIESSVDPHARQTRVSVHDSGPGIDPSARDRIFQPFFTSKGDGTGLGLALVQKVIVFHNGRVDVGTSPLGGASLQITLPLGG